jgi:hypothetical protein
MVVNSMSTWRGRLLYAAMSLFLGWHVVAVIIAPLQDSNAVVDPLRSIYRPYLNFFGLNTTWDFFSPIGKGHQFRYVVEDQAGNKHEFVPIRDFFWYLPAQRWFEKVFQGLMTYPEFYAEYFGNHYCRKHAPLKPVTVTLLEIQEEDFFPEDQLAGKHPLSPEFVAVNTLRRVECQGDAAAAPSQGS